LRWHGAQTIVISNTAAPARTSCRRPLLHVVALDGQVLADRARVDADRVQVLLRDEQHLALRRVRMCAALEPLAGDGQPPLVLVGTATLSPR
jgi:hypothetical protein